MKQCSSHIGKKERKVSLSCGCQFPMISQFLLEADTGQVACTHPFCAALEGPQHLPTGDRYGSEVDQVLYDAHT